MIDLGISSLKMINSCDNNYSLIKVEHPKNFKVNNTQNIQISDEIF